MRIILLFLCIISFSANAQTFSNPESVEYDTANSRWLVGNHGSGKVLVYNPSSGSLNEFCTGMTTGPYGMEILDSILYCCDGGWIRGYSLSNGTNVFNLNIGASFLNGITTDGTDFLFVTDFSAKKIYRVNVAAPSFNIMATTLKTPNGIVFDAANNRCVFATWGSAAAIQSMNLSDSTITTLLPTTLSNIDGITRDLEGNYYFSSWGNQALSKSDSMLSSPPVVVKTGLNSPADLDINAAGDSVGIPNSGSLNNVVFHVINNSTGVTVTQKVNSKLFPNPASDRVSISLDQPVVNAHITLYDARGLVIKEQLFTGFIFSLERNNLPGGVYTLKITMGNQLLHSSKIVFN